MPSQIKAGAFLAPVILLGLLSFNAQGRIYQWVDENGTTHFTQQPPPAGIEARIVTPPPDVNTGPAREQMKQQEERAQKYLKDTSKAKEDEAKKQQEAEAQRRACEQARTRLQSFERPRVNFVDKDGTRRRATEEERQAELKKTQEYIDKNCN